MVFPVFVSLDMDTLEEARFVVTQVAAFVRGFKIGMGLFYKYGPEGVHTLVRSFGEHNELFLDLKLFDIPHTMMSALKSLCVLSPSLLTVHLMSGFHSLKFVNDFLHDWAPFSKILGVSVLTSSDEEDLGSIGIQSGVEQCVSSLIRMGYAAGLRGFVCSAHELSLLRSFLPHADVMWVVPGIRCSEKMDDQKRIASPELALSLGATALVIGRPIVGEKDPQSALFALMQAVDESYR